MSMVPTPGAGNPRGLPVSGAFAVSEVIPLISRASTELATRRAEWRRLRDQAAEAKAHARKTRADLIVRLRVWGNDQVTTPIKTSAERQEWANADPEIQQAELEADLAQTAAMDASAALEEAQTYFEALRSMLAIERDQFREERGAPPATR